MSFNSKQLALRPEELAALTQFSISNELLPPSPSKLVADMPLSQIERQSRACAAQKAGAQNHSLSGVVLSKRPISTASRSVLGRGECLRPPRDARRGIGPSTQAGCACTLVGASMFVPARWRYAALKMPN